MNYLNIILTVLPSLISLAEQVFNNVPKSGAQKKQMVMGATQLVLGTMGAVSTGGQAKTWAKLSPSISQLIDIGASLAFPNDTATTLRESPESPIM